MDRGSMGSEYRRGILRSRLFILVCVLSAAGVFLLTLGMGVYDISVPDAVAAWFGHLSGAEVDARDDYYVWDVRFPRAVAAALIGGGLAIGGAVMQSILKNPLADPYTMGVSSGAFFGAVLSIICGISIIPSLTGDTATVANAFITSLISVAVIMLMVRFKKMTPTVMILVGIAVMYIFSSANQYLMVTADEGSLSEAYSWRVGTLANMEWSEIPFIAVAVAVMSALLVLLSGKVNVLNVDDRYCQTLGVNVQITRVVVLLIVALLTATAVCFTGTIGFVGLVCPHIARMFVGSNSKQLLPASFVFGAVFLLAIDAVAKVTGVNGLPVGVISALIGGPVFVYMLVRRRRSDWL